MIRREELKKTRQSELRDVRYETAPPQPPSPPGELLLARAAPAAALPPLPRVAVLAIHGMGQQVPFETLEQVAVGVGRADGQADPQPAAANCAFDDVQIRRLELPLASSPTGAEVHFYEAYWAPITEGQVKLRDVFVFLIRDTWRTLLEAPRPFIRWMFGDAVRLEKPAGPILGLLTATIVLINLTALNFVAPAVVASQFRSPGALPIREPLLRSLTLVVDVVLAGALATLLLLWVAAALKRRAPTLGWARRPVEVVVLLFLLADVALIATLPISVLLLWRWPLLSSHLSGLGVVDRLTAPVGTTATWIALLVVTLLIRYFLIQYVGDVAAYITPQALDRFAEIRQRIKNDVRKLVQAVLSAKTADGAWEYERVAFVGHSLGSVIAYDALNRAITDDALGITQLEVLKRATVLVTFGSPLDKTAFVFGLHGKHSGRIREQLAARVQPLIEDYGNRANLTWINVFSRFDIISGPLDFYDQKSNPSYPRHKVKNTIDKEARIPLVAHTEYWANSHIWKLLHAHL
jgi:hypothetical protein